MPDRSYRLQTAKSAIKFVEGLRPTQVRDAFQEAINDLAHNPHHKGHRLHGKLRGFKALELRVHKVDYRIVFRVDDELCLVRILDVDTHEGYNNRLRRGF